MATTSNVRILHGGEDELSRVNYPVTIATSGTFARGDLMTFETSTLKLVDNSNDNTVFVGVSNEYKESGDNYTANATVLNRCIIKIGCTSATYGIHNALKYAAGANGTDWSVVVASSGADGIMWSLQYAASAITTINALIDVRLIGTALGSGTGIWEGFAS